MIFLACSPPSQHGLSLPSPSSQTEVWFEHRTADGRTYYSHPQTQKTTWERPPNAQIIPQPSPGNVLHEQSTNHISLKKIGLDVLQSHSLCRICFAHYLISYAEMGTAILCIQIAGLIQSGRESSKAPSLCAAVFHSTCIP